MNKDMQLLIELLQRNKELNLFVIRGNTITYDGKTIDFENFNISYFLDNNKNFIDNIHRLTPKAIFDILNLHVQFLTKQKEEQEKIKPLSEEDIKRLSEKYPILKRFHIVTQELTSNKEQNNSVYNEFGTSEYSQDISEKRKITHVHYIDEQGINHLLYDTTGEELINIYRELIIKNNRAVTEKELYEALSKNKKSIPLECLNEALMNGKRTEKHLNNLRMLNDLNHQTGETLDTPLGNEENGIYISHYKVITYSYNKDNEYVKQVHENKEDDELSLDNPSEEKIEPKEEIPLIDFIEYKKLLLKSEDLTEEEEKKIKVYENFLFDIVAYKEYLTNELYEIYLKFQEFIYYIYQKEELSKKLEEAKQRYIDMLNRAESLTLTNKEEKILALKKMNEEMKNAGSLSTGLYLTIIIIIIGLIIALIILK